ncbi:MAG: ROK family protein [Acidimicrobiia bacterium]|nr:ROK family protein [Acidimicrobiia bacterium]
MGSEKLFAGIEAGGTKWRVAIGRSPELLADTTIATTDPDSTISACVEFIRNSGIPVEGTGIAAFGPLDLDPNSNTYGFLTTTPKPGWSNTNIKSRIEDSLGVPVVIDIDVGGAALGEWRWGAGRGLDNILYVTVGTGFGGASLREGRTFHELGHPEMGHITVEREKTDTFPGSCPFHRSCLEGMAAGPAISARWGRPGPELSERLEVWDLEARYLAQGMQTYIYTLAPQRIILGGGVMQQPGLLDMVRKRLEERLAGYGPAPSDVDNFIAAPEFGQDAGLIGAIALARRQFEGT